MDIQESLASCVRQDFLNRPIQPLAVPHSAMSAIERHQGMPAIYLTNEAFMWSHRFYCLGKVMEGRPDFVVDVGCGEGYLLRDMRHNRVLMPYIGLDVRPLLKTDKSSAFVQAMFSPEDEWPLVSESCPMIILSEVLEHFTKENGTHLLGKIAESLLPGGWLVVTCPANYPAESPDKDYKKYGHLHYWDFEELWSLFSNLGMEPVERFPARFARDMTSYSALRKEAVLRHGEGAGQLLDELQVVYGPRVIKHLVAHLRPWEEATGLKCVFRKEAIETIEVE